MQGKYRGKATETGKWVKDFYCVIGDVHYIIIPEAEAGWQEDAYRVYGMVEVQPASVGRSTGESKWEEGEKIFDYYENDIVEVAIYNISRRCYEIDYVGVIVWNYAGFRVRSLDGTREEITGYDSHVIRRIGNTTDNPELLENKP